MTENEIRVLEVSKRRASSPLLGWPYAIKFVREGESGVEMMWLDEFLKEHSGGVKIGAQDNE